MTPAAGQIVNGRLALVREIGRGSMGTVWLAEHRALNAYRAVKFMTGNTPDPCYAARFALEARAIARLRSPNVVRVFDYDFHEGVPFIAMEYLQGEDLAGRLLREKRLSAMETHRLVAQLARGVAAVHAEGIVHRDLKPGNVFLARGGGIEVAKLLDFGVAKVVGDGWQGGDVRATTAGALLGTPAYMSPEQARGATNVDHRADLWSLAVITFECLTGRLPFIGETQVDLFAKILGEPLPVPSEIAPSGPPAFDRWWARAAARKPRDRFQSAMELAEALGTALGVGTTRVPEVRLASPTVAQPASPATALARGVAARSPRMGRIGRTRLSFKIALASAALAAPLAIALTSGAFRTRSPHAGVDGQLALAAVDGPTDATESHPSRVGTDPSGPTPRAASNGTLGSPTGVLSSDVTLVSMRAPHEASGRRPQAEAPPARAMASARKPAAVQVSAPAVPDFGI